MRLLKFLDPIFGTPRIGLWRDDDRVRAFPGSPRLTEILHAVDPVREVERRLRGSSAEHPFRDLQLLAPIDEHEVWGAGVTYLRSKVAREEESEQGGSFYDLVYTADRPELFFKATPSRVALPGRPIRVRSDTRWCVPEPELALLLDDRAEIVGFTIGNDVSARDIEGVNPLYLPQAKVYDACCALGPGVTLPGSMPPLDQLKIQLIVERDGTTLLDDETSTSRLARRLEDLVGWLARDNVFPNGAVLLTGTGVVPPDDFSLQAGDRVRIAIDGIGALENPVVQS